MGFADRIKRLERIPARELLANPKNWRTHPENQRSAVRGALEEIGIAEALVAYETPDGLMLIDGHLRADVDPEQPWPVLVLDVDEREADVLLATLDPLAALAETNAEALDALLSELDAGNEALQELYTQLEQEAGAFTVAEAEAPTLPAMSRNAPTDFPAYDEDIATDYQCPKCNYQWSGKPK